MAEPRLDRFHPPPELVHGSGQVLLHVLIVEPRL
jgi:hypothetical protein